MKDDLKGLYVKCCGGAVSKERACRKPASSFLVVKKQIERVSK